MVVFDEGRIELVIKVSRNDSWTALEAGLA